MTDETNPVAASAVSATPTSVPENNPATTPASADPALKDTGAGTVPANPDDFDESIIPETSRDNFRKYRESQKAKVSEYENRLNEETRKRMEYEARIAQYDAQQRNTQQQPADPGEQPDYTKFQTIEEYRDALVKWAKHAGANEFRGTLTQQQQQALMQQEAAKMAAKGNAARAKYADFEAVTRPILPIANQIPVMVQFIKESDNGTDVLYHLGKNPVVLEALTKMQPFAAVQELLRIQAALSTPAPKAVSQAPAPITPVSTGGDGNVKSVLELVKKENLEDFVARENRKEIRRRKGAE